MADQDGNAVMLQELSGYQLQFDDCQKLLKVCLLTTPAVGVELNEGRSSTMT